MKITHHKNSILNPDVVEDWSKETTWNENRDKADRGFALLENVRKYMPDEYDRAVLSVAKWRSKA